MTNYMRFLVRILERIGTHIYLGTSGKKLKYLASKLRYYQQLNSLVPGDYRLYIAGLPKSGTTWLESILTTYLGTSTIMPPEITKYEGEKGESHSYVPTTNIFRSTRGFSCVIKTHAKKSEELLKLLSHAKFKVILLTRDINEVLESHIHYAKNTKHHPDYPALRDLDKEQVGEYVQRKYSDELKKWVEDWQDSCIVHIKYQDMVNNTFESLKIILNDCKIPVHESKLREAIESNNIDLMRSRAVNKKFFRGSKV